MNPVVAKLHAEDVLDLVTKPLAVDGVMRIEAGDPTPVLLLELISAPQVGQVIGEVREQVKIVVEAVSHDLRLRVHALLKYSSKDQDHRGEYKKVTNHVEAFGPDGKSLGVVFETAIPFETPGWMKDIVDWFNRSVEDETL